MNTILNELDMIGIVPVIKIDDAKKAAGLAGALAEGGLPCAEITFRTPAAAEAIRAIADSRPDVLVGAGTVLNVEQAKKAVDSGAKFIVSPGFSASVVDWCVEKGVAVIPGVNTPTDIEACLERGLDTLKFFPAEASGGVAMLDALAGPFPNVKFIPTGGIDRDNLASYAKRKNVIAVAGTWMVKQEFIEAEDWKAVSALTRDAVRAIHGFSLAHVGINSADETAARETAGLFSLFGFAPKEGNSSIFCDSVIEVMKTPFRGRNGHIAIACWNLERALAYLGKAGIHGIEESARYDGERLSVMYLDVEMGGFAVHLVRGK